ncbi:MAG: MtnX-like HAD-IB family phosphatase [Helicobacteraceae bacterium]|jgi:2,3-diketo-5-methylthio-1-phosphopentane phosphatase|nr:MtnX-like HAD-IB family phosphatase [Helicobacteraceae bacterium]
MSKYALLSDFDGTISDDDFFFYVAERFFDAAALAPWRAYLSGEKSHFDALKEMFGLLRLPQDEFDRFVAGVRIDWRAASVFTLCRDRQIPIFIASAGCDYYIKKLIGDLIEEFHITLLSNRGEYSQSAGLTMIAPNTNDLFYDPLTGISKYKLAKSLKDQGYTLIFAGDGLPDFESARISDVVFARKALLQKCKEANIKTKEFSNFDDIASFLKEHI